MDSTTNSSLLSSEKSSLQLNASRALTASAYEGLLRQHKVLNESSSASDGMHSLALRDFESLSHRDLALFALNMHQALRRSFEATNGLVSPQRDGSFAHREPAEGSLNREMSIVTRRGVTMGLAPVEATPERTRSNGNMSDPASPMSGAASPNFLMSTAYLKGLSGHLDQSIEQLVASTVFTDNLQKSKDDDGFKKINNYLILKEIGRGQYGKVKLAADTDKEDRLVAIKVIARETVAARFLTEQHNASLSTPTPESMPGESVRSSSDFVNDRSRSSVFGRRRSASMRALDHFDVAMLQEVAVMKKLRHPNIVRLHEVIDDSDANKLYFVMQYIERGPLLFLDSHNRCTPIDPSMARSYMKQLISAVSYLHSRNIVHRDIKPDNILLSERGRVYLSDFGVSLMTQAKANVLETEGTPAYMAPELMTDESGNEFDPKAADIWALGVTFFVMVYGELPWHGASMQELRTGVFMEPIEEVLERHSGNEDLVPMAPTPSNSAANTPSSGKDTATPPEAVAPPGGLPDSVVADDSSPPIETGKLTRLSTSTVDEYDAGDSVVWEGIQEMLAGMLQSKPEDRWSIRDCRRCALMKGAFNALTDSSSSPKGGRRGTLPPDENFTAFAEPKSPSEEAPEGRPSVRLPDLPIDKKAAVEKNISPTYTPRERPAHVDAESPKMTSGLPPIYKEQELPQFTAPMSSAPLSLNGSGVMSGNSTVRSLNYSLADLGRLQVSPADVEQALSRASSNTKSVSGAEEHSSSPSHLEEDLLEAVDVVVRRLATTKPHLTRNLGMSVNGSSYSGHAE